MNQVLKIRPSEVKGIFRFWIDGVDVSRHVDRAEIIMYPGETPRRKLILGTDIKMPDKFSLEILVGRANGNKGALNASNRSSYTKSR